jgi:hypothetical protein
VVGVWGSESGSECERVSGRGLGLSGWVSGPQGQGRGRGLRGAGPGFACGMRAQGLTQGRARGRSPLRPPRCSEGAIQIGTSGWVTPQRVGASGDRIPLP